MVQTQPTSSPNQTPPNQPGSFGGGGSLANGSRKKGIAIVVSVVLLVFAVAGGVYVLWDRSQPDEQSAAPTLTSEQLRQAREVQSVGGTLDSYSSEERQLVITADNREFTMTLSEDAAIAKGMMAEEIEMSEIPVGATINVQYSPDNVASTIWWIDE